MRKHAAFPTGAPPPGYRLTVVNGLSFVVEARYTPLKTLGCGAYGVVCAAAVAGEEEHVAIKKMGGIFDETKGSLGEAKRALRELLLLRHLQHDNLLTLRHVMLPPPDCGDVYIVSDLLDSDLSRVIASPEALSEDHVRYFLYQLLCGVQFLHSANVVHRDLKPSNILVNRECDLRIADFGLARSLDEKVVEPSDLMPGVYGESGSVDSSSSSSGGEGARAPGLEPSALMTQYVVTRWYRAPELLLLYDKYSHAVDIWSVGCILAELLVRKPLFPGHNFKHQLQLIIDLVGSPPADSLGKVDARIQGFVRMWSGRPAQPLATALPAASAEALSLLEHLLQFQPQDRIAADGALRHSYLDQFADEDGSLQADPPITALQADMPITALPADLPITALPADLPITALPADPPTTALPAGPPPCAERPMAGAVTGAMMGAVSVGAVGDTRVETATNGPIALHKLVSMEGASARAIRRCLSEIEDATLTWPKLRGMLLREVDFWAQVNGVPSAGAGGSGAGGSDAAEKLGESHVAKEATPPWVQRDSSSCSSWVGACLGGISLASSQASGSQGAAPGSGLDTPGESGVDSMVDGRRGGLSGKRAASLREQTGNEPACKRSTSGDDDGL